MFNLVGYITGWPGLVFVITLMCLWKLYLICIRGVFRGTKRLFGKTVIVTGANTGIGKETARDLAGRGARVILACRDLKKANEAKDEICRATGSSEVFVRHLDLSSLASVRKFAQEILATESQLDILINNAGAGLLDNTKTEDGLLMGMQVNHFGPFLLTNLLLDLLKKSSPSRIIFVASILHKIASFDVDHLNFERSSFNTYVAFQVYCCSKLANILTANELARKLAGTGVTVNSLEPGTVGTGIFRSVPVLFVPFVNFVMLFTRTVKEGAQTTICLAVSDEVEGVTGKYFSECKEKIPTSMALDKDLAKKLWEKSAHFVNLKSS